MIKHKKIFILSIVFIVIFALVVLICCIESNGEFVSEDGFPKSSTEFFGTSTSEILGSELGYNNSDYLKNLLSIGQLGCWNHKAGDWALTMDGVFDMELSMPTHKITVKSTTSDGTKTASTNTQAYLWWLWMLYANVTRTNNSDGVYVCMCNLASLGAISRTSALSEGGDYWNGEMDGWVQDRGNSADTTFIEDLVFYEYLSKNSSATPTDKGEVVQINNKEYAVLGPFKVNFGGVGFQKITAGSATWSSSSRNNTDIYWSTNYNYGDWSNDFSILEEDQEYEFYLDRRQFYLAVNVDCLPEEGTVTVSIKQKSISYFSTARLITTCGENQDWGLYDYKDERIQSGGSATWSMTRNALKTLNIEKTDKITNNLVNAGFKIYAVLNNGTKGWVTGQASSSKTYGSYSSATTYTSSTDIKKLKFGTYYIYETQVERKLLIM